ncbi:FAD-dependent oxidoreductase [Rhodococcus hoagii]|nr:FAD-dependent oxidoreductase [Prescottella equi]MBM4527957.1 FAD-dependent oxidoreductase [Prescottella equi]MBM4546345.1 FAD-dependent oxidoreductase [Prescottella equi]MBM4573103.1 FAD-dependent oxidoreductase [Prescottella equi]MBM4606221.1 FAD-dependent oxidoreductase [Prescottella equi]
MVVTERTTGRIKVSEQHSNGYDVVVVGGGAAGLEGALMLARSRRSVLVIDAGEPRNAPAEGVHGFLSRDGIAPADLTRLGADEVRRYGGEIADGAVSDIRRVDDGFSVVLADGRSVDARRVLVTTGLTDELPDVPGVRERWGRDVLHCPYCHGWEINDEPVGVLGTGPMSVHQALMFRQWTDDVTLFLHTAPQPTDDEREQLAARGIRIVTGRVAELVIDDDRLAGVRLDDGTVVDRRALVVAPRFAARVDALTSLGVETELEPMSGGRFVPSDWSGLTKVPGLWVAGNVTDVKAQVLAAAAGAATAAVAINNDLIAEDTARAVAERRAQNEKGPQR